MAIVSRTTVGRKPNTSGTRYGAIDATDMMMNSDTLPNSGSVTMSGIQNQVPMQGSNMNPRMKKSSSNIGYTY